MTVLEALVHSNSQELQNPQKSSAQGEQLHIEAKTPQVKCENNSSQSVGVEASVHADVKHWKSLEISQKSMNLDAMCEDAQRIQNDLNDEKRAIEIYEQILKVDSMHVKALSFLGALHHQRGRLDEAKQYYHGVLGVDPGRYNTIYNLGRLAQEQNSFEEAMMYYEKCLELKSSDFIFCNALAFLGLLHQENRKDYTEASKCYGRALARNPLHIRTLDHQCALLVLTGRREEAKSLHARILKEDPNHALGTCQYINTLLALDFDGTKMVPPSQLVSRRCTHAHKTPTQDNHNRTTSKTASASVQSETKKKNSFFGRVFSKLQNSKTAAPASGSGRASCYVYSSLRDHCD